MHAVFKLASLARAVETAHGKAMCAMSDGMSSVH
jgi:hypothetical protein